MKKQRGMTLLLALVMALSLGACGVRKNTAAESVEGADPAAEAEWPREGYFQDEAGHMVSVTWMEDTDPAGWYIGCLLGEDWVEDGYGGMTELEGTALKGSLAATGEEKEPLGVTVTAEGADGLQLVTETGETFHLKEIEMQKASIFVTVNIEGWGGGIDYAEGETAPEIDTEYPYQSAQINLAEPTTYTLTAWAEPGNFFVKWMKDGADFSAEPTITVLLDESADFIAVFEEDPDWQNPVMNFVGEYQCDRAHALVECFGTREAWITIEWGSSAWELARWDIVGVLDTDTLTITYKDASKRILVYGDDGEVKSEETEYNDGTGSILFRDDGTFIWHEDQSVYGTDMVFDWVPVQASGEF